MRRGEGAKCRIGTRWLKKTIDHIIAVGRGQIQWQAFRPEGRLNLGQKSFQIDLLCIDLVHNNHPTEPLRFGGIHHAPRYLLDTGLGIDDDCGSIRGRQDRQRATEKVPVSGGVDQIDVYALMIQVTDGSILRVPELPLSGGEVRYGIAAIDGAALWDGTTREKQCFCELGLSGIARSNQAHVANIFGTVVHWPGPDGNRIDRA